MASVGDRIREIREARKMTQDQLAEQSGISKGFLSGVENNKRNIEYDNLLRVANVLGASLDYLLRGASSDPVARGQLPIPSELTRGSGKAEYFLHAENLELLDAHRSVVARRSNKQAKRFTVEDWERCLSTSRRYSDDPWSTTNLNNHIVVQRLALDLGLRSSATRRKDRGISQTKVQRLIEDFDGHNCRCRKSPALVGW